MKFYVSTSRVHVLLKTKFQVLECYTHEIQQYDSHPTEPFTDCLCTHLAIKYFMPSHLRFPMLH